MTLMMQRQGSLKVINDLVAWVAGLGLTQLVDSGFATGPFLTVGLVLMAAVACAAQLVLGKIFYLYRGRYRYGSFEEIRRLFLTPGGTAEVLLASDASLLGTHHLVLGCLPP